MKYVNYFLLGDLLYLLERIEMLEGVPFENFDPDDEQDVKHLAEKYACPYIRDQDEDKREAMRVSIEYYAATNSAPFQLLKDRCQELSLPDARNWALFFMRLGKAAFGEENIKMTHRTDYCEWLDEFEV